MHDVPPRQGAQQRGQPQSPFTHGPGADASGPAPFWRPSKKVFQLWDGAGCLIYANPASHTQFPTPEALGAGRHWTALAHDCRAESGGPRPIDDFPVARAPRGERHTTPLLL